MLAGLNARLPDGVAEPYHLSSKNSLNQSASQSRSASNHSAFGEQPSSAAAPEQSLTWSTLMKKRNGRPSASMTVRSLVVIPPLVRPIGRPLWSPGPPFFTAGWSPWGVPQGCCVEHFGLRNCRLCGRAIHPLGESTSIAQPLPADVDGLRRAIFPWRVAPVQVIGSMKTMPLSTRRSFTGLR